MSGYALSIARLYGSNIIRVAAKHLLRELAAELGVGSHIDAERVKDNVVLRGPDTSAGVAALAKSLMEAAGVTKCRKGAVMGLELLFTLPGVTAIDPRQYFEQATRWAEQYFGVPVLSCVIHADEEVFHAHVLLLPLVDGHMVGSDLHGGKAKLAAMQSSFHEAVGGPHGLPKYSPKKRLSAPVRAAAMGLMRGALVANASLNDRIIDVLLSKHAQDPEPLMMALGIAMPEPVAKREASFAARMTKPCKPELHGPIGKQHRAVAKSEAAEAANGIASRTCVGKGNLTTPNSCHSATNHQHPADGLLTSQHTPAAAGPLRKAQAAPEPSTTGQAAPASASTAPSIPAPGGRVETVSLAHLQTVSLAEQAGAGKLSDTPTGLQKIMDTPASVDTDHQPGPDALASQSAESSAHLDVSSSARISSLTTDPTKRTNFVRLVHHQAGACEPSYTPRPKLGTTDRAPCPDGMRPHTHPSKNGRISTAVGGDVLKTEQVDRQAGHADAHWCSLLGGGHPGPQRGMETEAEGDYHRQRDDEQPAETWCADLGEFVQATGPPHGACHLYP